MSDVLVIVPARNEAPNLPALLDELAAAGDWDILVIDDGSADGTAGLARTSGVRVISHATSRGYGATLVTGYRYALERAYTTVVTCDGDGQHPPAEIHKLLDVSREQSVDMAMGSRLLLGDEPPLSPLRGVGIWVFSNIARRMTGVNIRDVTSGFAALNRDAVAFLVEVTPDDFPDANVVVQLLRAGLTIGEVPVRMRRRRYGSSMNSGLKPVWYVARMAYYLARVQLEAPRRRPIPPPVPAKPQPALRVVVGGDVP